MAKKRTEIEQKIFDVVEYFKNKLLTGDFKVTEIGQFVLCLKVDKKYTFSVWISNFDIASTVKLYSDLGEINFIHIDFTDEESELLHEAVKPYVLGKKCRKKRVK